MNIQQIFSDQTPRERNYLKDLCLFSWMKDNIITSLLQSMLDLAKHLLMMLEGKTVEDLVKYASTKGQVLLVQRNLEGEDTICIEAARRYFLLKNY